MYSGTRFCGSGERKKAGRRKKNPSLDHGELVGITAQSARGEWDPGVTIKCPVYSPLKCGPSKEGFVLLASYLILRTKGMEVNNSLVNTGRGPDALGPRAASETPPQGERGCVNSPPALRLPSWGPLGPAANSDEPPCTPL